MRFTSMVLLNGLITNDKFCMRRLSPSRVHWARRPSTPSHLPLAMTGTTMILHIVEVPMKRQWHIHHQFHAMEDGAQRWDQAYQLLLH